MFLSPLRYLLKHKGRRRFQEGCVGPQGALNHLKIIQKLARGPAHGREHGCCGKPIEKSNYYIIIEYILGVYWESGKENGNYYIIIGYILGV